MRKHALPVFAVAVLVAALITGVDAVSEARSADPSGSVVTSARPVMAPAPPAPVLKASRVKKLDPWEVLNADGIPRPLTVRGWGDRPSTGSGIGWEKWTYPRFP